MFINLIDCHTHTRISFDSEADPCMMVDTALKKNIEVYAFTDHSDHCSDNAANTAKQNWENDVRELFLSTLEMKERYQDAPIKLLSGIELGEPLQDLPLAKQILKYDFDMVLGSLHNAAGEPDFFRIDYRLLAPSELDRLMEKYFSELYAMVEWGGFDTLAHLTFPLRYIREQKIKFDLSRFDEMIVQLFQLMIHKGIALELNTSGLARGLGYAMPDEKYLKLYRQIGGRYLTIGSDAHKPEHVGGGITEGLKMALRAGFTHITYFEKRKPVLTKIR